MANTDPEWQYIEKVWNADSTYRAIMLPIRATTRMEKQASSVQVFGDKESMSNNGRPLSIVMQYRSLALRYPPVDVIAKDDTDTEEGKALKIQQHLTGVPYRVSIAGKNPYVDALHHGAEVGRSLIYTVFDESLAAKGRYPLRVRAIDPLCCGLHEGEDGLLGAVIRESYSALDLYSSLKRKWDNAQERKRSREVEIETWSIPKWIEDKSVEDPLGEIETSFLLQEDKCVFYVRDERMYGYSLLVPSVPIDVAYCMDLPSKKPEQKGLGLIYPISGMLDKEWMLLNKETLAAQFFTFPFVVGKDEQGELHVRQLKPSDDSYGVVNEMQIVTPTANYQGVELLLNKLEGFMENLSLAKVSFGEGTDTSSGYQVSLLTAGPMRRIEDELSQFQRMWERQYGRMLREIEYWADAEGAARLGFKGEEAVATYLSAWTTISEGRKNPDKKNSSRAKLLSADVKGYGEDDIRVSILPETPQDENAKFQRAGLAKDAGMPQNYIDEFIIKVDNPAQVKKDRDEEILLTNNQDWANFMMEETRLNIMEKDKKLSEHWAEFMKAQGKNPDGSPLEEEIDPNAMPVDPMAQPPPPDPMQDPMAMNVMGGLTPDMQGMPPSMMPPAEAGQIPSYGAPQGIPPLNGGGY